MKKLVRDITCALMSGACLGSVMAIEVDSTSNDIFDLYYFGTEETGIFGTRTGVTWMDSSRETSGYVKDSTTYYWNQDLKQAMLNAVNTWTDAISTPYDKEKHSRKLRVGFFLDDASRSGGTMSISMAGYAGTQVVTTHFETQYGTQANIYSVAEWAWRDNNETDYYKPSWVIDGAYWESNILASESDSIDIAIVLNPIVTSYGYDAQGNFYRNEIARTVEQMQNIATHELAHGMGVNSYLYTQDYDSSGNVVATVSDYVSTWDSLVVLDGQNIVTVQDGEINAQYETLQDLHAAGWECNGDDPTNPENYTGNEIQYDPDRRLSLNGELGVHIAAIPLEGDMLEHLSYDDGTNVLGPGGTENSVFSENDLRALEMLGWSVNRDSVPEPTSGVLIMLSFMGLAWRRRRA